ncbi:hypothetical protein GN956_G17829 [Arapaima gigas]
MTGGCGAAAARFAPLGVMMPVTSGLSPEPQKEPHVAQLQSAGGCLEPNFALACRLHCCSYHQCLLQTWLPSGQDVPESLYSRTEDGSALKAIPLSTLLGLPVLQAAGGSSAKQRPSSFRRRAAPVHQASARALLDPADVEKTSRQIREVEHQQGEACSRLSLLLCSSVLNPRQDGDERVRIVFLWNCGSASSQMS